MKTLLFTGYCPQCELYEENYHMWDNGRFWECPLCALQIHIENDKASIFRHRGNHHFPFNYKEYTGKVPFQEVGEDSYPNGIEIHTQPHLIEYLLKSVFQKPYYSIDNLIDYYTDFKLDIGSANKYLDQSHHFQIDFENEDIVGKLQERDKQKNYSFQYETARLYHFLVDNVLPKYASNEISLLPEMGMSQLQYHLCQKNIPDHKRERILQDKAYSKQALKDIVKDLIDIIYFDKMSIFNGDVKLSQQIKKEMYNN